MLSIYYAKKTGNGYILNFFADSTDDVEAFNPDKSWGMYGKPIPGSVLTVTSNEEVFNYYLNESGALVEIAIDTPIEGLVPFSIGQTITGYDFGNVSNGSISDELDLFLSGLPYTGEGGTIHNLLELSGQSEAGLVAMNLDAISEGEINGYLLVENNGDVVLYSTVDASIPEGPTVTRGYQNLSSAGKYEIGGIYTVSGYDDHTEGWNGILVGALEGEPGPSTLTPFSVGQYITGIDFGDAVNGQVNEALSEFVLASGDHESDQILFTVNDTVSGADGFLTRFASEGVGYLVYVINEGESVIPIYATATGEIEGTSFTPGFQNLVDGKVAFENNGKVMLVNTQVQGWNGILMGAVEGEAPALTPFVLHDYISGYKVNVEGDTSALDSFLAEFPTTYGEHKTILESGDGGDGDFQVNVANTVSGSQMWEDYVLFINGGDGFFIYSTNEQHTMIPEGIDVPAGWSSVDPQTATFTPVTTNQEISLQGSQEVTKCESLAEAINGVYVGAIPGEAPEQLVELSSGQTITGYKFDTSMSSSDVINILSSFDYKSITDGVIVDCSDDHGMLIAEYDGKDYFLSVYDKGTNVHVFDGSSWVHLSADGTYMLISDARVVDVESVYATGWNGVFVGAIVE